MNFHNKTVKRIVAIIVLVIVVAMVAAMIIPYIAYEHKGAKYEVR